MLESYQNGNLRRAEANIVNNHHIPQSLEFSMELEYNNRRIVFMTQRQEPIKIKKEKITTDYKFLKELGRGSSGVCYLVANRDNTELFRCVKKIEKHPNQPIPNEILFLDQLTHPNIVRLYEVYEDNSSYYMVIDLCEGGELFDYLDNEGALSEHEAKEIFIQIISALRYCHQKKIAHRDLKPQNFLLANKTEKGQTPNLKLIDFDLSFQWKQDMQKEAIEKEGKRLIGTPYYIAPELMKGKHDKRCDIWSAGVILFILVTGVPPFGGNNANEILKNIQKQQLNLDIPEMDNTSMLLKDLLKKLLTSAEQRLTIQEIFSHPWMKIAPKKTKVNIDFSSISRYSKFSRLKQIAASYLTIQMTVQELSNYQALFKQIDTNKDGFLSIEELKAAVSSSGKPQREIQNLLQFVETDGEGMMNYMDFMASFVNEKVLQERNNLQRVFKMIDNDGNGYVEKEQLNSILSKHGLKKKVFQEKQTQDELNRIFAKTDKNNDGKIDFEEFLYTICNEIQL